MHSKRYLLSNSIFLIFWAFSFPLFVIAQPANDFCPLAQDIPSNCNDQSLVTIQADITNATATDNPAGFCAFNTSLQGFEAGVWYTYTPVFDSLSPFATGLDITINTCNPNTDFDAQVAIFEGNGCTNLTCLNPAVTTCGLGSTVSFTAPIFFPPTYYFYLYGAQGAVGNAEMTISCNVSPPANDLCENAFSLSGACGTPAAIFIPGSIEFATATDNPNLNCNLSTNSTGTEPGIWYQYIPANQNLPPSSDYELTLLANGSFFSPKMTVLKGPDCTNLTCISSSVDTLTSSSVVQIPFNSSDPETYFIYVYGDQGVVGDFILETSCILVSATEAGDLCTVAGLIPAFCDLGTPVDFTVDITTATASDNPNMVCGITSVIDGTEPGVWYQFSPTLQLQSPPVDDLEIEISTCFPETDFDTQIAVFTGNDCDNLTCVTSNDDGYCSLNNLTSKINLTVPADSLTTYFIYLYGYQGAVGTARLNISCNNPDETCLVDKPILTNQTRDFTGDTDIGLPKSLNCPTPPNSRGKWFGLPGLPNDNTQITISTCNPGTNFDAKIKVYAEAQTMTFGPCAGSLFCIAEGDSNCNGLGSSVSFNAGNCRDLFIFIYGEEGNLGTAEITYQVIFPGEICEEALAIDIGETKNATTTNTVIQSAPAVCGNIPSNPGVWFSFTGTGQRLAASTCNCFSNIIQYSPANCELSFDPCSDTRITIFEGSSCQSPLTCLATNDDFCGDQSRVEFDTEDGQQYYIFVDNPAKDQGDFSLSLNPVICNDVFLDFSCPADITITAAPGDSGAIVNYTLPEISPIPNCPIATFQGPDLFIGLPSGSFFPIGTTQIFYLVGVSATSNDPFIGGFSEVDFCTFNVTVQEPVPIPTMSEWSLFLFGLFVLTLAVVTIYNLREHSIKNSKV